ncbi:hypothetical protein HQ576_11535 [bacterium]|nr:hypothetical protein [bacterium]
MRTRIVCGVLALSVLAFGGEVPLRKALGFSHVGVYGTLYPFCDYSVYKLVYAGEQRKPERLAHFRKQLAEAAAKGKRNLVGLYTFDRVRHSRPIAEYVRNTDAVLDAIDLAHVHAVFLSEENVTWSNGLGVLNGLYDHIKKRHPALPVYQWLTAPMTPHAKLKADGWVYDLYGTDRQTSRRIFTKYVVTGKPFVVCINASPSVGRFDGPEGEVLSQAQVDICREFNLPMFFFCVDSKWGSPAIWLRSEDPALAAWRRWLLGVVNQAHRCDVARLPLDSAQYSTGRAIEVAGDERHRVVFRDGFASQQFLDDATLVGLLNLRWDGGSERLWLERQADTMDTVELQYHFVSDFELSDIAATLRGRTLAAAFPSLAPVRLALSATGHSWPHQAVAEPGDFALRASAAGDAAFKGKEFWVRIQAGVPQGKTRVGAAVLDALDVTCAAKPPARRAVGLVADAQGRVVWRDDFASQKHLHLAHITGKPELEWRRGQLGTHGVKGRGNVVALRWKFVSEKPLAAVQVRLECMAHARALGATNVLAVSLDGEKKLAEASTREQPKDKHGRFRGALAVDLTADARFQQTQEFWVHVEMHNNSGARTNTSNTLDALEVNARLATP